MQIHGLKQNKGHACNEGLEEKKQTHTHNNNKKNKKTFIYEASTVQTELSNSTQWKETAVNHQLN